jgi:hypothetical protein
MTTTTSPWNKVEMAPAVCRWLKLGVIAVAVAAKIAPTDQLTSISAPKTTVNGSASDRLSPPDF